MRGGFRQPATAVAVLLRSGCCALVAGFLMTMAPEASAKEKPAGSAQTQPRKASIQKKQAGKGGAGKAGKHGRGKRGKKGGGGGAPGTASAVRPDVLSWILAHNPGLDPNFLRSEAPDRQIKLPDGQTLPIYRLKQFLDLNFRLTFFARRQEKGSDVVPVMEERLRKLLALPQFHELVKTFRGEYQISPKGKVSSQEAYNHFRHVSRHLGVTAGKQYHAPVGGGDGIAAPSWAVWKAMNIFYHEACHCIGIGHDSGGLSGPIAGKLRGWDKKKLWDYSTVDLNGMTLPSA